MASVSGHVIVCGLSALGVRVAEQLVASGVTVVVVDDQGAPAQRRRLERQGVRVVPESPHSAEALREADIDTALAVAACHDIDLENLQTALAAADVAPTTRLVVNIGNAQLGDQIAAAIPTAHVINMAARVGPSFVEACVRSDVVHAFTMDARYRLDGPETDRPDPPAPSPDPGPGSGLSDVSEVFVVAEVTVDEADAFRARYGDLTPISLRRPSERVAVLCPPRDIPLFPGDRLTVLGRLAEFDTRGMAVAGLHEARTFATLAAAAAAAATGDTGDGRERADGTGDGLRQDGGGRRSADRVRALAATVRGEFDRPFRWALGVVLAIMIVSTTVLTLSYADHNPGAPPDFDALDALYLTVETMATVGYGDYNFGAADHWLQAFGVVLMLVGALSIAVIYAFITNIIISRRLERALGRGRAGAVRGHVVLCGLGKVGTATMEGLLRAGRRVVVIERDENNRFLPVARERGVPVVVGDATVRATLLQAGLGHALALAALTSDGVANLETVLSARDAYEELVQARDARARRTTGAGGRAYGRAPRSPEPADEAGLRVVLRIADSTMTDEVERRFNIHTVRSAAALASPYFIGATLGYDVISTFYVERTPFLVARMAVRAGAALAGPTLAELATGARVLAVTTPPPARAAADGSRRTAGVPSTEPGGGGSAGNGARPNFRPGRHTRLRPGDELLVVGPVTEVVDMIRLNQSPADGGARAASAVSAAAETDPLDD
ncbi:NAD-binding protein [Pseudofrankia sp. BMG5.36]|uniref:NAD-binding protein n=1 Tax=Pseudofrankia sp. BMG5.36 TaxID=1834512 RepID=UPI0008D9C71A|nr:NAD-binding protein [Pseudofrankia sp. BMG5.36]OHV59312.1 potassium transporter TrkA [Pseudofrankia sp. BMG5.36]